MARDSTQEQNPEPARQKEQRTSILIPETYEENENTKQQNLRRVTEAVDEGTEASIEACKKIPETVAEWMKIAYTEHAELSERLKTTETKLKTLEQANTRNLARISKLNDDLEAERQRDDRVPESIEPDSRRNRSIKFPDPEIFKNNDDGRVKQWLRAIRDKLRSNADHFPTEDHKKSYVYSRLGGEAFDILEPRMNEEAYDAFLTVEEILTEIHEVYGDKNEKSTARKEFKKLLQREKPFSKFYGEFRKLAAVLKYDEQTLIDELQEKVSFQLQTALAGLRFETLSDAAQKCALIDQDLQKNPSKLRNAQNKTNDAGTIPRKTELARARSETPKIGTRLSEEDKKDFMAKGKCFNCHKAGHVSRDCPDRTNVVNEVAEPEKKRKATKRRTEPMESDDDSDESKN